MIDAVTFATSFNAFWRSCAPTCELFVRRLNLDGLDRFDLPIQSKVDANRRAFVAEYAFSKFSVYASSGDSLGKTEIESIALQQAIDRLRPYVNEDRDIVPELTTDEVEDATRITSALRGFFIGPDAALKVRPRFSGCGYIDQSEGDVIFRGTLYEVKTVDRPIRSADIRQLLTYAALNYNSNQFTFTKVGVFNPRRGQQFELELEQVSSEVSGRPAAELFWLITSAISSGDISI